MREVFRYLTRYRNKATSRVLATVACGSGVPCARRYPPHAGAPLLCATATLGALRACCAPELIRLEDGMRYQKQTRASSTWSGNGTEEPG